MSHLTEWGIEVYSVNVDYLHEVEIGQLAALLSNAGLWGRRGGDSEEAKVRYISRDCESQVSAVLLDVLESPYVIDSFRQAFAGLLAHPETKKAAYVACLLQQVHGDPVRKSLIASVTRSNHVYSREFDDRINSSTLFEFRKFRLVTSSALFCAFILRNFFSASYSIDQLISVYATIEKSGPSLSYEESDVQRRIMTFGTLTSVLPVENRKHLYHQFYDKLKRQVPRIERNPHYWLQYAMAVMSLNNLGDAKRLLENAYAKAGRIAGYDTTYIDNQYARLYLLMAIEEEDQDVGYKHFEKAHRMLMAEEDDVYKFRPSELYFQFHAQRFGGLSKGNRVRFEHSAKAMRDEYAEFLSGEFVLSGAPPYHVERVARLTEMIADVQRRTRG